MKVRLLAGLLGAASLLLGPDLFAQSNNPAYSSLQLDLFQPGARNLALGGAFVGLADDASAAWANPAGLFALDRFQVSADVRGWTTSTLAATGGRLELSGAQADFSRAALAETSRRRLHVAYGAAVIPAGRWRVAVFYRDVVRWSAHLASQGVAAGDGQALAYDAVLDLDARDFGVAVARRLGRGWRVGGAAAMTHLDVLSDLRQYLPQPGGTVFDDRFALRTLERELRVRDLSLTAGLHWVSPGRRWRAGAAYRYAPQLEYESVSFSGPTAVSLQPAFTDPQASPYRNGLLVDDRVQVHFDLPDELAAGLAFRPHPRWLLTAQAARVSYSQLGRDSVEVFGVGAAPCTPEVRLNLIPCVPVAQRDPGSLEALYVEAVRRRLGFPDVTTLRAGVEWEVRPGLFLRAGGWHDADHRMRLDTSGLPASDLLRLGALLARLAPGGDVVHASAGLGLNVRRFHFSLGVDLARGRSSASLSVTGRP